MAGALLWVLPGRALGETQEAVKPLYEKVDQLYRQGRLEEAIPVAQKARQMLEDILGKEHPYVATSLNNQAELYRALGDYVRAESLYQRSLKIFKKTLDPDDPWIAMSLNNLAKLYQDMGEADKARSFRQQAQTILDTILGQERSALAAGVEDTSTQPKPGEGE